MSAVVYCGKRSSSIFDELLPSSPSSTSSPSPSPSPPITSPFKRSRYAASSPSSHQRRQEGFARLCGIFPNMDPQLLEKALEASGDDLDSAIKSLTELRLGLESADAILSPAVCKSENGVPTIAQLLPEGIVNNGSVDATAENAPTVDNIQTSGSEWVELFVREMMNASDMNDARARASRALEALEKSIVARAGAEAVQNFHKENMVLKEQVEMLLRENALLKRAVAIQHERQKESDERNQELQHLKQVVLQYQEQVQTLEINNYALTMHLKQAEQNNSIPGRFHPDVF